MAGVLKHRLSHELRITLPELRVSLQPLLHCTQSNLFYVRVRHGAIRQYYSDNEQVLRSLPSFINQLNSFGHSAEFVTLEKQSMLEICVSVAKSNHKRENKSRQVYERLTIFDEQKVRDLFQEHLVNDYKYFCLAGYVSLYAKKNSLLFPVFATMKKHIFILYNGQIICKSVLGLW